MTKSNYISNFEKHPALKIKGHSCYTSWKEIGNIILQRTGEINKGKKIIAVECYHGVNTDELIEGLKQNAVCNLVINANTALKDEEIINHLVYPFVTDDPVFGYITTLQLQDFFSAEKVQAIQDKINESKEQIIVVAGIGATFIATDFDLLIYADMPRWETQLRFRKNKISNLGASNMQAQFSYQYKRSYFVDWRVCDSHKRLITDDVDYYLDTTIPGKPKLVTATAMQDALIAHTNTPFRLVPFFDPGPWGGQWLKEVCDLPRDQVNYAWGFDCVPEENSLLIDFNGTLFEIPSINLVFTLPEKLLGPKVFYAFGAEFPIRFDFLDTMQGGNLSLQVHPLKEYIRKHFGMGYTQDESYYMLDAGPDAFVYLGLKEQVNAAEMVTELEQAQESSHWFDADKHVEKWPVKKHDHILIPSGTVHCSGANSMVLEISATPYIFTFKLWDWGRFGLDGKPRPISLEHGKNVIQWDRTTSWTGQNLINQTKQIAAGDGWREEQTGLDSTSFIETRRHWFTKAVTHFTNGSVNVLNLVEGRCAIVESPDQFFNSFIIHYAETFVVPASVESYTIRPYGESEGKTCATVKAFVRTENLTGFIIS